MKPKRNTDIRHPAPAANAQRLTITAASREETRTCGGNVIDWMTGNNPATFEKWLRCTACGKLRKPEGGAG